MLRSFSKSYAMAAWRVGYAVGPPAVIETLAKAFMWQSLAIDAVAQAAALAALTGPQDWIEAAVAELGESRPLAVAAANGSGVLRAELPESARVRLGGGRGRRAGLERAPRARARDPGPPRTAFRRGDAAPEDPVRRPPRGARGAAQTARLGHRTELSRTSAQRGQRLITGSTTCEG